MEYLRSGKVYWLLCFLFLSCGGSSDDGGSIKVDIKATGISVRDAKNNGDASDLRVSFSKPSDIESVSAFRIFLSKSSSSSVDVSSANDIPSTNYHEILTSTSQDDIALTSDLKDVDGDPIAEGVEYTAYILSIGIEVENALSPGSESFELAQTNLVETLVETVNGGSGGLAIDVDGNVYMGDFGQTLGGPPGDKVFKITPEGIVSVFATGLVGASGNDFDSKGNLFQSNIANHSISKVTPDGTVSTFASGTPIINTVGISIDENDELFVADCDGHKILKVDLNGNISVFATSGLFRCPNGLTRDDSGNLYAANFYNGDVLKVTPQGDVSVLATLPGGNNGHLVFHGGILYVIARSAGQIYKVSLTGDTELFAGSGSRGSVDGAALEASFSLPNDLIFSHDGKRIYVNDVVPLSGDDIAPCSIRVIELVE